MADNMKFVKTYTYPGWTIDVYRPELDEKERERRMKLIHDSAAELIKDSLHRKEK